MFHRVGIHWASTAIVAADNGIEVIGVDVNPKVVETINRGKIHIVEPGLADLAAKVVHNGGLRAQLEPEVSDVYLIVVPTPFTGDHEPDISYVEAAHECDSLPERVICTSLNRPLRWVPRSRWRS